MSVGVRIQHRRDTAAAWTSNNPILAQGEPGLEADTGRMKTGDGSTAWTALTYLIDSGSASNTFITVIRHGSTANTARTAGATLGYWIGAATPSNAVTNDLWSNTGTPSAPVLNVYNGTAFVAISASGAGGAPAAHAATHATGGSDPLSATQIGADASGAASAAQAAAVQRANHTGTQAASTITGLGGVATLNIGLVTGTVAAGDDVRITTPATPGPTINLSAINYRKLRRAVGRVRAGTAFGVIACVGDSTTHGAGATGAQNYPSILAGLLNSYYCPAAQTWAIGWSPGATGISDSRVAYTGTWANTNGFWQLAATGSGTLSYAPSSNNGPGTVDTVDVYMIQGNAGSLAVNVNGGATISTISAPGSLGVVKKTVTFTATTNPTINFVGTAVTAEADIIAINAYLSTSPVLQIANAGIGGTTSGSFASATTGGGVYAPQNFAAILQPDMTVIDLGINDAGASVANATYSSNMQTIISRAQTTGDVLLKSMCPSGQTPNSTFEPGYVGTVLPALAASNSCALLDVYARFGSFTTSNALGYYFDNLHPSQFGYSDVAQAVFNVIKTL